MSPASAGPPREPRIWRRTRARLADLVPPERLASALGDLQEDYAREVAARGRIRARLWLRREVRSLASAYAVSLEHPVAASRAGSLSMTSTMPPHQKRSRVPGLRWLFSDVRHAIRRWRRRPGFALTAIVTLALGIGATTAIFSVVDAVLLRPLPWPEADRLVRIHAVLPERLHQPALAADWNRGPIGWREWDGLQASPAFTHVAAWLPTRFVVGPERSEVADVAYVSSNFLQTIGSQLLQGRPFNADEDRQIVQTTIVTFEAWRRRFGGRDVVGETIVLGPDVQGSSGRPWTIVGVLAPGFRFQGPVPDFLLPIGQMSYNGSFETNRFLRIVARLAPGATMDDAFEAAEPVVRGKETRDRRTARLVPVPEEELGRATRPLYLLLAGSALLLLVACSNVAGLLLGEARARRHEIAVRTALGGGVFRILRQLAVEQALIAALAASLGVVLAVWAMPVLVAMAPDWLPRLDSARIDLRLALAALAAGLGTSLLFTLGPALSLARTPAAMVLAEGSREAASHRQVGQRLVVATEVALALVLLVGASLFGETIARLTTRPLGFDPDGLAVMSVRFPDSALRFAMRAVPRAGPGERVDVDRVMRILSEATAARTKSVLDRIQSLPGVVAAAGVNAAPFVGTPRDARARADGRPQDEEQVVASLTVTDGYFRAVGTPVVRGRALVSLDAAEGRVMVSREFEKRLLDGNAIGRRIALRGSATAAATTHEVIGVVENVKHREFSDEDRAAVYALDRNGSFINQILLRTSGDAEALLPIARQALEGHDSKPVVTFGQTMESILARSVAEPTFRATLSAIFGASALLLAAVGLYGLAARRVAERRREIGVRIALGARPRDVRRLVVRDTLATLAMGLAVGLPGAFAASQVTRTFLFDVSATAPHTFVLAASVLTIATVVATLLPARRAAAIDPMLTLKD